ncbi:MAG: gamma-glutamylcyclotransferase [Planctomycetales bacterium]|nr:gamma-glutamylcyclotransferase [Planctomycetales bacterium]
MHLFTYGTLMFAEVWRRVVPREFATEQATVRGYRVRRAAGELFPVMMPAEADAAVTGVVYFDVDVASLALLDEYESTLYDRVGLTAVLPDGRQIECQGYVLPHDKACFASNEPWTPEWFREHGLRRYLAAW